MSAELKPGDRVIWRRGGGWLPAEIPCTVAKCDGALVVVTFRSGGKQVVRHAKHESLEVAR